MSKQKTDKKNTYTGEKVGLGFWGAKQAYEQSVGRRAYKLGKNCKNLKGHVAEVMTCDRINLNPRNIIAGKKAFVTNSRTAPCVDVVVKQNNKVIERLQVKNTPSLSGIRKTVKQVAAGKYNSAKLVGTKETAQAYNATIKKSGNNIAKTMTSNNVRTAQTEIIQAKTIGGSVIKNGKNIIMESANTAKKAGVISAGIGTVVNGVEVYKGKQTVKKAAANVAKDSVVGYMSAGAGNMVDAGVTMTIAGIPGACPLAKPIGAIAGAGTTIAVATVTNKVADHMERKNKLYA